MKDFIKKNKKNNIIIIIDIVYNIISFYFL